MKEEDIRKRDVLNRYLELVRLDAENFFRDRSGFQGISCPACRGEHHEKQFAKNGFEYVLCSDCDTLFVSPRPPYRELMKIYADSPSTRYWVEDFFKPMAEARREKIFKPRAEYIVNRFPDLASGLIGDIGAGFGIFLEELKKIWPGSGALAIEPSVDMADICRGKGLPVIESMLEDIGPEHRFDLLTAFELVEHLHNPEVFMVKVAGLLNPGGRFFMTTLNGLGFDIQLLWEASKSVTPPHHLNFFNPHSIRILLERSGFEIIEITTPGQLDWDIIEGGYRQEGADPGRFFRTLSKYGSAGAKGDFQAWIRKHDLSSHMRVIAKKR